MKSMIAEMIEVYYGERCDTFDDGCDCCKAWAEYDGLMRAKVDLETYKTAPLFEGEFTGCDFDLRGGDYDCAVLRKDGEKLGDIGEGERIFYNEITNKLDANNLKITVKVRPCL